MAITILECEQRSPEWYAARLGMPTASEFATVLAFKGDARAKQDRMTYMRKLAGERLTRRRMDSYTNAHMERGIAMEQEAREAYSIIADAEVKRVGFIFNNSKGCSPDGLVGKKGMVEIKTALPHILINLLLHDEFPAEHKAQCQGNLWVAERDWIDIAIYNGDKNPDDATAIGLPLFVKRAKRDETYIKDLDVAVRQFNDELNEMVEKVKRYGGIK